jgi:hypothetical protein
MVQEFNLSITMDEENKDLCRNILPLAIHDFRLVLLVKPCLIELF